MKKVITFTGSNSSTSINKQLLDYASSLTNQVEIEEIDLRNFDIPMYGNDLEKEKGVPSGIEELVRIFDNADGFMISCPEHNSIMPAFFKNILDWLSRTKVKYFKTAPILLIGTSPGGGGAGKAIELLSKVLLYGGGELTGTFSLPAFNDNFADGKITNEGFDMEIKVLVEKFENKVLA